MTKRISRASTIVTLTMNPTIDLSFSVNRMESAQKMRCHDVRRDPGGGGINVARVVRRLGGRTLAVFPAGGRNGQRLEALLKAERTPFLVVPIAGETREDPTAEDASTGEQYRFVMPGPRLRPDETAKVLDVLGALAPSPQVFVASGSLPPGAPTGFYARLARMARSGGAQLALDASGPALRSALAVGVWVVKPNEAELEELVGSKLPDVESRVGACRSIVDTGGAQFVALSMGDEGALLVSKAEIWRAAAPRVSPISTVGAGDSFTAALVMSLAAGRTPRDALVQAVASGSAALLAPGTQLCRKADVEALARRIHAERIDAPTASRSRRAAA